MECVKPVVLMLALMSAAASVASAQENPTPDRERDRAWAKLTSGLKETSSLGANFDVTVTSPLSDTPTKRTGSLFADLTKWAERPRFTYEDSVLRAYCNGDSFWLYTPGNKQVVKGTATHAKVSAIRLLTSLGEDWVALSRDPSGQWAGKRAEMWIVRPKASEGALKDVRLYIDPNNGVKVLGVEFTDPTETRYKYAFSHFKLGGPSNKITFTFVVPADADVVMMPE